MEVPTNRFLVEIRFLSRRFIGFLLKRFFALLYHQFAWTYDWVASFVSLGEWKSWVLSSLTSISGPKILEIGFGPGHLQTAISQIGLHAIGLDQSKQMCRLAHKRLRRSDIHPNLINGIAQNLPFQNAAFDQVVMTFPSEYIFNPSTFSEIHRILVDKGTVVIVAWARITGQKPRQRLIAWLNRITGQSPDLNETSFESFIPPGFKVTWETRNSPSSQVLLFKLYKQKAELT